MYSQNQMIKQKFSLGLWFAVVPAAVICVGGFAIIIASLLGSWNTRHDEFGGLGLALPVIVLLEGFFIVIAIWLLHGLAKHRKGAQYAAILIVPFGWSIIINTLTANHNDGTQSTVASVVFIVIFIASLVLYIKEARQSR